MKQKTVKTASKRISVTGSGKLQRRKTSAQHLVQGKSKRTLKGRATLVSFSQADNKRIKKLVPNR
ncbi:MAG: 50S ribosomal protein L35 [Berkelbacteria bacterium GW2011_GWA1_36_9]|uniref:50S ribosomal protein L35 n=1 Tax=Berkelbacteria bacterium GW2011_GWA1_36_9 TaxID=1618331 RepID=A0A0G0HXP9_9BACT|nr:MAG: 50S ribosomal protein L35 [Berkelbacteria bacterium GW2011_GWA1_36_9]